MHAYIYIYTYFISAIMPSACMYVYVYVCVFMSIYATHSFAPKRGSSNGRLPGVSSGGVLRFSWNLSSIVPLNMSMRRPPAQRCPANSSKMIRDSRPPDVVYGYII